MGRLLAKFGWLAIIAMIAACNILPGGRPDVGSGQPTPPSSRPPPSDAGRPPTSSIPERSITLAGSCAQKDEDGYREDAKIDVQNNVVRALSWRLWVGRRGSCQFEFADFTQTKSRPHIELTAKDGTGCKLLVYQEPRRVTIGHAQCQKRCVGDIYDEAWPVMFDPKSGSCAAIG